MLADVYKVAGFGPFIRDAKMLQAVYNTAVKLGALQLSPKTSTRRITWTTSDLTSCYLVPTVTLVSLWASTAPTTWSAKSSWREQHIWTLYKQIALFILHSGQASRRCLYFRPANTLVIVRVYHLFWRQLTVKPKIFLFLMSRSAQRTWDVNHSGRPWQNQDSSMSNLIPYYSFHQHHTFSLVQ